MSERERGVVASLRHVALGPHHEMREHLNGNQLNGSSNPGMRSTTRARSALKQPLAMLLILLILASCGGTRAAGSSVSTTATQPPAPVQAAPTDPPTPVSAPTATSTITGSSWSPDQQAVIDAVVAYHTSTHAAYGPGHDGSRVDSTSTAAAMDAILCVYRDRSNSLSATQSSLTYQVLNTNVRTVSVNGSSATLVENRHDILTFHKSDGTVSPSDDTYTATYTLSKDTGTWLVSDYSWTSADRSSGSAAEDSKPCAAQAAGPSPTAAPQNTSSTVSFDYQVAEYTEQGVNLDVVFMGDKFAGASLDEQRHIWLLLQGCASSAGANGVVVPVWRTSDGALGFLAPEKWHPYFLSVSFDDLQSKVNKKLTCHF